MLEKGDAVRACGKLKRVVDFLEKCDKEDLRLLSSFFEGEAKGPADAKNLRRPLIVKKVYAREEVVEVELTKTFVWEEKLKYFQKVDGEEEAGVLINSGPVISPAAHNKIPSEE